MRSRRMSFCALVHFACQSEGNRCFNSSRLVCFAFSISERVMIWLFTRAIISSTILSARRPTTSRTTADASKDNFLSMFERPFLSCRLGALGLFYQPAHECGHLIERRRALLLRFFLLVE